MMKQHADNIINKTNYDNNCHGLQAKQDAETIAEHYFNQENLSYENWFVREIPLTDNNGEYPVAIVLCVNNNQKRIEITLNITREGNLFSVCPDELCEIENSTIKEAISHLSAQYWYIN